MRIQKRERGTHQNPLTSGQNDIPTETVARFLVGLMQSRIQPGGRRVIEVRGVVSGIRGLAFRGHPQMTVFLYVFLYNPQKQCSLKKTRPFKWRHPWVKRVHHGKDALLWDP